MGQTKSFIEVLEEQIRTDLRREIEAEVRAEMKKSTNTAQDSSPRIDAMAGSLETWLATHVGRTSFARKATYAKSAARPVAREETPPPVAPAASLRVRAKTVEEICALELLLRHSGSRLGTEFTETELRSVWRRAALKSHPDRFVGQEALVQLQKAALFRELASAYETLGSLFDHDAAA
ncbi:MAG: J domain-containing protein [Bdellovibrionota bacterium]